MKTPRHLGGHMNVTHIDVGTFEFIVKKYDVKSFVDVGCGPMGMVNIAHARGLEVVGIDGDPKLKEMYPALTLHDYTNSFLKLNKIYDLGWSVEFLEHVSEKYMSNYMETFKCCKKLCITHAPPNKNGHHHVNCKDAEYWKVKFKEYGFAYDEEMTGEIRNKSTMVREFMRNNGLFFNNIGI
jgi:hypothetical protein